MVHPDDRAHFNAHVCAALKNADSELSIEYRIIHKDGGIRWIGHHCRAVYSEDGLFLGSRVSNRDITGRKIAEEALRQSENNYRNLVENTLDIIYSMNNEGRITFITPNVSNYGYTPEDFLGHNLKEFIHPDDIEGVLSDFNKVLETGVGIPSVFRFFRKAGDIIWLEEKSLLIKENGKVTGFVGVIRDITERKLAEKMQNLLHDLKLGLNFCTDLHEGFNKVLMAVLQLECFDCGGIYITDPVDNSLSIAAHTGLSKEFISLVSYFQADSPNARLAQAGEVHYGVYSDIRKENDTIRDKEGLRAFALIPIMAQGRLIALLNLASHKYDSVPLSSCAILETIAFQIGESLLRFRTENALRESQKLFELYMFHSPVYSYIKEITAAQNRVLQASDSFKALIGFSGRDILGKTMQELFPADFAAKITADDQNVIANKKVMKLDEEFAGRYFTTIKFPIEQGDRTLLAGYSIDITERKIAEEALRESETKFRAIFESSRDAIGVSIRGMHVLSNSAYLKLFGFTNDNELAGTSILDRFPESHRDQLRKYIQKRAAGMPVPSFYESRCIRKDGTEFDIDINIATFELKGEKYSVGIIRDVTDRNKLKEEMQKVQKLESLGILAGGIAHDFNNLLSIIYGNLQLVDGNTDIKDIMESVSNCLKTIKRAKSITGQLLTFAKGGAPIKKTGNFRMFIRDSVKFILSGSKCVADFFIEKGLWAVDFDENQMGQVIDNIVVNAVQAMPKGGRLKISLRNVILQPNKHPNLSAGNYVKVSFKDAGIGMLQEILSHVFDPYFTTKKTGRGLGLASVYSIIKKHNGYIDVESVQGKGSTFHIYLPAAIKSIHKKKTSKASVLKRK